MFIRFLCTLLLALGLNFTTAFAQSCNFSITTIDFGNVNLGVGGAPATTGTLTASCTGNANSNITICPNIGDGTGGSNAGSPRFLAQGGNNVGYNLYQPNGQIWGSFVWPYAPRAPILSLTLNAVGTGTLTQNIDAQLTGTVLLAPSGVFQSIYNGAHTLLDYGYAPAQSCSVVSARAVRSNFIVRAQNNSSCNISTTSMNFGSQANLTLAKTASNQISITCTTGVRYTVGLSYGANGGTSPVNRFMAGPLPAQKIQYGIYQNASLAQAWGTTIGKDTIAGTATGLTQAYNAYGQIPAQTTPQGGSYADTVVVTVTY